MGFLYVVRCNFSEPSLEKEWNDWYNGPKMRQMLDKPYFLSGQRFRAAGLDQYRRYLALWGIEDPAAFTTPEYLNDWGFSRWAEHIEDWSRDLFELPTPYEPKFFAIPIASYIRLISCEDLEPDLAIEVAADLNRQKRGLVWMKAAGLDRSSSWIGIGKVEPGERQIRLATAWPGVRESLLQPISDWVPA